MNYHGQVIRAVDAAKLKLGREHFAEPNIGREFFYMPIDVKEITDRGRYVLLTSGALPNGAKVLVVIRGIEPYLDVKCQDEETLARVMKEVASFDNMGKKEPKILIRNRDMKGFILEPVRHLRLYFANTKGRKEATGYFLSVGLELASDLTTCYYRVAGGTEKFKIGVVNTVRNHSLSSITYNRTGGGAAVPAIDVDVRDIEAYDGDILSNPELANFKCMLCAYDEEMQSADGSLPDAFKASDTIFVDGMSFFWKKETTPMLSVVIVSRPCAGRDDRLTIIARDERELLQTKAIIFGKMMPDVVMGFNNGGYDEIFIIEKAMRYKMLSFMESHMALYVNNPRLNMADAAAVAKNDDSIYTWNCRGQKLKLESGVSQDFTSMKFFGYIVLDIRMAYRMMYPTEEKSSLSHFLAMTNSGAKEDMPIHRMFGIYRRSLELEVAIASASKGEDGAPRPIPVDLLMEFKQNKEDMSEVAHYCKMDAELCQVLQAKGAILDDKANMAALTGISLHDAIYSAGGMKVKSLIASFAEKYGIACSMGQNNTEVSGEKYIGAHVVEPNTNIFKPKLSFDELPLVNEVWRGAKADELAKCKERVLGAISDDDLRGAVRPVVYAEFSKWLKQPNYYPCVDFDFTSLYPSIIMAFNYSPEMLITDPELAERCQSGSVGREGPGKDLSLPKPYQLNKLVGSDAWVVSHDSMDGESPMFGLYPTILRQLFKWRADCKLEIARIKKSDLPNKIEAVLYWDTKQKSIKVLMNTFYGVLGEKTNPLYRLPIALGITLQGQRLIKFVQKLITSPGCDRGFAAAASNDAASDAPWIPLDHPLRGGADDVCRVGYGDTDSSYLILPNHHYLGLDAEYYGGLMPKDRYLRECLKITAKLIRPFQKLINDALIADTKTTFLKMENEKIYFPIMFLEKKMYAYSAYNPSDDFDQVKLVPNIGTKGLAINKRGCAEMVKISQRNILEKLLDHYSINGIIDVLKEEIAALLARYKTIDGSNIGEFTKTAVYKPGVNNVNVKRFNERLRARGEPMLEAAERFTYVIVAIEDEYTLTGSRVKKLLGDQWEYASHVAANPRLYEIDLLHYISGGVDGMMAQFVATILFAEEDHAKRIAMSKKFVSTLFKQEMGLEVLANKGKARRKEFTEARKIYKELVAKHHRFVGTKFKDGEDMYQAFKAQVLKESAPDIADTANAVIADFIRRYGKKCIYDMNAAYSSSRGIIAMRLANLRYKEDEMRRYISNSGGIVRQFDGEYERLIVILKSIPPEDRSELVIQVEGGVVEFQYEEFMALYKEHLRTIGRIEEAYSKLKSSIVVMENANEIGRLLKDMVSGADVDVSEDKKIIMELSDLIAF